MYCIIFHTTLYIPVLLLLNKLSFIHSYIFIPNVPEFKKVPCRGARDNIPYTNDGKTHGFLSCHVHEAIRSGRDSETDPRMAKIRMDGAGKHATWAVLLRPQWSLYLATRNIPDYTGDAIRLGNTHQPLSAHIACHTA